MVRILTICQQCGDVEATLDDISLQVWGDTHHGEYTLECPICETATVWPASSETVDLLVASGAAMESVPREPKRAFPTAPGHRPPTGPGSAVVARRRRRAFGRHLRRWR